MIKELARAIARHFHNRHRIYSGAHRLYALDKATGKWSRTCHTVGDRIWTDVMKDAEPMHVTEFAGKWKHGEWSDRMRLLGMEGWTEVWVYTEEEFKEMLRDAITDAVFKDLT